VSMFGQLINLSSLIKPYRVDTKAATEAVETETRSRVVEMPQGRPYSLFSEK
jgi:hypothetical protein